MTTTSSIQNIGAVALCALFGCQQGAKEAPKVAEAKAPVAAASKPAVAASQPAAAAAMPSLTAKIKTTEGSTLEGTITLTSVDNGVKVSVSIKGAPAGKHGAHIHEKGDCSAADFTSAGGHFNPMSVPHALPPTGERHLGDLGNIEIAADGTGTLELLAEGANLKAGDAHSFIDRAFIMHEKPDTGEQPTGGAGGRIGCAELKAGG